jgi:hypothetical protein
VPSQKAEKQSVVFPLVGQKVNHHVRLRSQPSVRLMIFWYWLIAVSFIQGLVDHCHYI